MFGKRTRLLTMLAASAGIPYAWFNENVSGPVRTAWEKIQNGNGLGAAVGSTTTETSVPWPRVTDTNSPATQPSTSVTTAGPPLHAVHHSLDQALRFDITPRWVIENWTRVSTIHADGGLSGFRVALVTGTNPYDVAGALTYYFDPQQQLRRITLRGETGDDRGLVRLVTERFSLTAEPTREAGMYVRRWNTRPLNVLRISHASVVRADRPNSRLMVDLELNDVSAGYGLSSEAAALLEQDERLTRRIFGVR